MRHANEAFVVWCNKVGVDPHQAFKMDDLHIDVQAKEREAHSRGKHLRDAPAALARSVWVLF